MKNNHYVYLTVGLDHRFYIGVRSCECLPEEDTSYVGSFSDNTFIPISKHIQRVFKSRKSALAYEIELHNEFDVACNPQFANKAKQTSTGFCVAGRAVWLGKNHTEETKWKIGRANSGRKHSKATRQRMSESHLGRVVSQKTRKKLRNIKLGNQDWLGKSHSEETKQKIREKLIARIALNKHPALGKSKHVKTWIRKDGVIEYDLTPQELAEKYELNANNLRKVASGNRKSHQKWRIL